MVNIKRTFLLEGFIASESSWVITNKHTLKLNKTQIICLASDGDVFKELLINYFEKEYTNGTQIPKI